jgi:hypothetical protein
MGGVANVVAAVVKPVTDAFGLTGDQPQRVVVENAAEMNQNQANQSGAPATNQPGAKMASGQKYQSERQQAAAGAVGDAGGGATLLTGPGGAASPDANLGQKTLLGG